MKDGYLFKKPTNPHQISAKITRDWPDARGIWQNLERDVVIWLNETEHLKLIATEAGGDIDHTFRLFCAALEHFELEINVLGHKFMWDEHLGYVVSDVNEIGKLKLKSFRLKKFIRVSTVKH